MVDFLIIGAMKSGTTSLYHYLKTHPSICMPKLKEPGFFVENKEYGGNWDKGFDWYKSIFEGPPGELKKGEASTCYTKFPFCKDVPERIKGVNPGIRLIYLLRDPIERLISHYLYNLIAEKEFSTFEGVFSNLEDGPNKYLEFSKYYLQIEQYLKFFNRERILLIKSEDLNSRRKEVLQRIFSFLEIQSSKYLFKASSERLNETSILIQEYVRINKPRHRLDILKFGKKRKMDRVVNEYVRITRNDFDIGTLKNIKHHLKNDFAKLMEFSNDSYEEWKLFHQL